MLWVPNFIKMGAKIARVYNFGSRSSVPSIIFIINIFDFHWVPNFIKVETHCNFEPKSAPGQYPRFSHFQIAYLRLTNLTCSEYQLS